MENAVRVISYVALDLQLNYDPALVVSSLSELRTAFTSPATGNELSFTPRSTLPLPGAVTAIAFASNDSRLLVGYTQGSIAVYDTRTLCDHGTAEVAPLQVFPSPTNTAPREIAPNPGDLADLVAVLYEAGGAPQSPVIQLLDVQKLEVFGVWTSGGTPQTIPTSSKHTLITQMALLC